MWIEILLGLAVVLFCLYLYLSRHYGYWKKKGIVYIEPTVPFGVVWENITGKINRGTVFQRIYTKYKAKGLRYVGAYFLTQPTLVVLDLDLTKQIMTKDFHHFVSRDFAPLTHEFISRHLFALEGQEWKDMRTKLSPTFTSGKMKTMFTLMERCSAQLQLHIGDVVLKQGQFEVKDLIARFTTDIIATCAFGLEVNSISDRQNEFFQVGQLIFETKLSQVLTFFTIKNFPSVAKLLNITFIHPRVSEVLKRIVEDNVEYRKKNNVTRNDFIDLLLKVKENKSLKDGHENDNFDEMEKSSSLDNHDVDRLTLEEMTAQAFVFFSAGFETAASTTSFCLYELAKNKDIQNKLRREIDEVVASHGGHVTYQAIQEMTYMDQVMNETLRRYASLPILTRVCTEQYKVPDSDLVIDKGVRIHIPAYAYHHDPDIYPDPYRFDPDRFSEENIKSRHHYSFIPFGEGPRICIGMRFGKLQVKVGLAAILSKYELSPVPDTPTEMKIHPFGAITTPDHPFSLNISPRTN